MNIELRTAVACVQRFFVFGSRKEPEMDGFPKLPKDTRRLIQFIIAEGGHSFRKDGEEIVSHPDVDFKVRTSVSTRRPDASRALVKLAKAVQRLCRGKIGGGA